ncbi:hypothetical protein F5878DRAFT_636610 [Lentinula raphanica]|uniref:Uncharacterized protein n=1 Tax=Lentinula raphanica TaxID=153919 RepID=A0AA38PMM7_9AGAR|nr:hypothetical protein C8R42DRAFT_647366 [Lentinula raphanica]KAJ3845380.1 hypothetical protein F5878DRAFT_636610 [Lentinula raphanica]
MRLYHSPNSGFRPTVYALINLRTRAQRPHDPLAPLALSNSCGLIRSLIEIIYEYGVAKIERNANLDASEVDALRNIETALIPDQWNRADSDDFSTQIEDYKDFFLGLRMNLYSLDTTMSAV